MRMGPGKILFVANSAEHTFREQKSNQSHKLKSVRSALCRSIVLAHVLTSCVCVCVCVCVWVGVGVGVMVKRPVLPTCAVDRRSRNPLPPPRPHYHLMFGM